MLNLADFFAMRPHKVEGGRLVKGYAMSGSKESSSVVSALDDQLREQRSVCDQGEVIENLKAELELMKREVRMKADENQAIYGQLAAAQKDAERYRWIRTKGDLSFSFDRNSCWTGGCFPEELDAAIDAAMEAK